MSPHHFICILTKTGYLLRFRLVACLPVTSTAAMTGARTLVLLSTDLYRSTHFGQSSVTRILDLGRPKNLTFGENFFFMVSNNLSKNHSNPGWSCQILIKNWLI